MNKADYNVPEQTWLLKRAVFSLLTTKNIMYEVKNDDDQ